MELGHFACFARSLVATFAISGPLMAAGVLTVGPAAGPGIDFTTIDAAISAASEGDIIVIKTGGYAGFTVDDKELTITADLDANVTINGPMRLQFLAPDKRVVVRGLTTGSYSTSVPGMTIDTCRGVVWLENMTISGGLEVDDGRATLLLRSTINGFGDGGTALVVVGESNVTAYETNFFGIDGWDAKNGHAGGDGVRVIFGSFDGYWCTMKGGNGGDGEDWGPSGDCGHGGSGGDGIAVDSPSRATLTSCSPSGGSGGFGCLGDGGQGLPVAGTGNVSHPVLAARAFSVTSPVRERSSAVVEIEGLPNEPALLLIGAEPSILSAPQFAGNLLAPPFFVASLGLLPASGSLVMQPSVGNLPPGVEGVVLFVQVVFATGNGVLGPASQLTWLDIAS